MIWRRHPSRRRLGRLADDECSPEEARRVRAHLARCDSCRAYVAFVRAVGRTAREIHTPRPPPGTLEEVLARRDAGERRILPAADPPPVGRRIRPVAAVVGTAALLLGAAAVFVFTSGEAAAGASELRLPADALPALAPLPLEYRAASELAAEERLRLRVRYRLPGDPLPRLRVGRAIQVELDRSRPGRFQGTLSLPPGAVYAVFSVEDLQGRAVDANGGRLWDALARDASGRPTFEALQERVLVASQVRTELAAETAAQMTGLYPERIEGWSLRLYYDGLLVDREGRDSLYAEHRRHFADLERRVAGAAAASADELAALVNYARTLEEEEAVRRWAQRLEQVAPAHRVAVQERVVTILRAHPDDPGARLAKLEDEWARSGPADELLLQAGYRAALAGGDPHEILTWADRIDQYAPHWSARAARDLAGLPSLRADGAQRLRRELRRLEATGPEDRALDRGVGEHLTESRRRSAPLLAALGRALLAEGDTASALDTLSLAARRTWDPELFRELAGLRLVAGDTAGSVRLRALAAADPLMSPGARTSLRLGPGPVIDHADWPARLVGAREELVRRMREERMARAVPGDIRVTDPEGVDRRLTDVIEGRPTLLLYWIFSPHAARRDVSELRGLSERVAASGARAVAVIARERPPELDAFARQEDLGVPVLFDDHGEVGRRLELRGRARYLVLDGAGRVRFRERDAREALRRLLLLSEGTLSMSLPERIGPESGSADGEGATGVVTDHLNMGGNDAWKQEMDADRVPRGGIRVGSAGGLLERGGDGEGSLWRGR